MRGALILELTLARTYSHEMISRKIEGALKFCLLLLFSTSLFAQTKAPVRSGPAAPPQRLTFDEARSLLVGESEGNISSRPGAYSETRLRSGQVLELYYPIGTQKSSTKTRTVKVSGVAGYGLLHESAAAYDEARRPKHILEELLPDGQGFVSQVPILVARLEKRLRVGNGVLDFSKASLRRLDAYVASYRRSHTTADTDPALFQELTAYYGEVLKRELAGQWLVRHENIAQKRAQQVPNVAFELASVRREMKPWSSVLNVLYNEDRRGLTLTASFDSDLRTARN